MKNTRIHKQQSIAKALEDSGSLYRCLFETARHGILIIDAETGMITDVNPFLETMLGFSREFFVGKKFWETAAVVDFQASKNVFAALRDNGSVRCEELPLKTKSGHAIWVEFNGNLFLFGEVKLVQCGIRDITERKKVDDALEDERNLLRTLIDNLPDTIYAKDTQGRFLFKNVEEMRLIGATSSEEVIGKTDFDFYPPELAARYQADDQAVIQSGQPLFNQVEPVVTVKGDQHWLLTTKVPWRNRKDEIVGLLGIGRDITERKQAEEALNKSEAELRALFAAMPDVVLVLDRDGRYLKIAPTNPNLLYRPADELLGKTIGEIFPEAETEMFLGWIRSALDTGQTIHAEFSLLVGEKIVWFDCSISPMSEDAVVYVARDITGRKQAEKDLQRNAEQFELLYEVGLTLNSVRDPQKQLETILDIAQKNLRAYRTDFFRYDPVQDKLCLVLIDREQDESVRNISQGFNFKLGEEKGLVGWVGATRQPLYLSDVLSDPRWIPANPKIQSAMWVPVEYEQQLLGVLCISDLQRDAFSPDDQRLLELFASQVAVAVENTHMYATLDAENRRLELLYNLNRQLSQGLAPKRVGAAALDLLCSAFGVFKGNIFVLPAGSDKLELLATAGMSSGEIDAFNQTGGLRLGLGMTGRTTAKRAPNIVPDVEACEHWVQLPGLDDGVRSAISVPLLAGDDLVGVLNLLSDQVSAFHDEHIAVLQAAAAPVAVALQSADLFAETHQRLVELETISKVSTALRAAQTLNEMLPLLLDATLEMVHATRGAIWLYDNVKAELRTAITRGLNGEFPSPSEKPGGGIAGSVFASGRPYISRELHLDPQLSEFTRQAIPPGAGGAFIPICAGDTVIGVFVIIVPVPRELTPGEIQLLITVSEIAGNAIQRTTLHEQTERRLQHLGALSVIDRAITSSFDLCFSLTTLVNQTIAELGVDAADVLLLNPGLQNLEFAAGSGFHTQAFERAQLRLGEGYAGRAALERSIIHVNNLAEQSDNPRLLRHLAEEQFVSYYGVPLIAKGQVKGVLEIFQRAPFMPDTEWIDFLKALAEQAAIAIDNASLFDSLQRTNTELMMAYDATIEGWSRALDLRDKETQGHTQRVTGMTIKLARAFGLSDEELVHIRRGALLHDIGKMGVPDGILLKPGPLTDVDWVVMKKHPVFAYEMLSPIRYLHPALDIPYCHHEKWDGTGYPRGLKGEQIPLIARIFSVVDVWDALNSDRPYRAAWPEEKVREYVRLQAGTRFEPNIVKICLESGILVSPKAE